MQLIHKGTAPSPECFMHTEHGSRLSPNPAPLYRIAQPGQHFMLGAMEQVLSPYAHSQKVLLSLLTALTPKVL